MSRIQPVQKCKTFNAIVVSITIIFYVFGPFQSTWVCFRWLKKESTFPVCVLRDQGILHLVECVYVKWLYQSCVCVYVCVCVCVCTHTHNWYNHFTFTHFTKCRIPCALKTQTGKVDSFFNHWKHTHVDWKEPKTKKRLVMETTPHPKSSTARPSYLSRLLLGKLEVRIFIFEWSETTFTNYM